MIAKTKAKPKAQTKAKSPVHEKANTAVPGKPRPGMEAKTKKKPGVASSANPQVIHKIAPPRSSSNGEERRFTSKGLRLPQFAYMKAPGVMHDFQVGDTVEVYSDHEKNKDRVRGWISGTVVQVDNKMVAVQFRSNVFLTDGWMVPDRILWYPLASESIRPVAGKKAKREKVISED